jgi:hypothetical protein
MAISGILYTFPASAAKLDLDLYIPQKMGYIFKHTVAVYIFDRYGVINNGFLCCFRGLAFFQPLPPLDAMLLLSFFHYYFCVVAE